MKLNTTKSISNKSRSKLTKKALSTIKESKQTYFVFERSYNQCMNRIAYMKAIINTYPDRISDYTRMRVRNLVKTIHKVYPTALYNVGEIDKIHFSINVTPKAKSCKLTILKDEVAQLVQQYNDRP